MRRGHDMKNPWKDASRPAPEEEPVALGDCIELMGCLKEGSVDCIVTDPPYGIGFMDLRWDSYGLSASSRTSRGGGAHAYQEAMRVTFARALDAAKPGAHMLVFGGTRTYHRLVCAVEDAGWEVRDCLMWVYGTGMPKGLDVGKAMLRHGMPEAERWDDTNTALKPAWEPIALARKPLCGTVAANVARHGTGALNTGACRVPVDPHDPSRAGEKSRERCYAASGSTDFGRKPGPRGGDARGRFPANLVHDGSPEVTGLFPESPGQMADLRAGLARTPRCCYGSMPDTAGFARRGDRGSAARFFYCAKASPSERGEGNDHPCVKPLALMEWLLRLVSREGQLVLDPFCGSGSTLVAAKRLGRRALGMECDAHYRDIAMGRLAQAEEAT